MKKLKGKCRTCLGCNKRDEIGFKGIYKCKYYKDGTSKEKIIIWIIMEMSLLLALGYVVYQKISMLCGG